MIIHKVMIAKWIFIEYISDECQRCYNLTQQWVYK